MGKKIKNKRNVNYIENDLSRNICYCKRKMGVLKKGMELSLMCGQELGIFIYDKHINRLIVYESTPNFTIDKIKRINDQFNNRGDLFEKYTNHDYNNIKE